MPVFPKPTERRSHIDNVFLEPRCQMRETLDDEHIISLCEAYQAEREIPRVSVWEVTSEEPIRLVVVDGYHRTSALRIVKREWLQVDIVGEGTLDEAAWYSVTRNHEGLLPRKLGDRKKAIRSAFENPIARDYTNTTIARQTGCTEKLVAIVRKEVDATIRAGKSAAAAAADDDAPAPKRKRRKKRKGLDGKLYPAPAAPDDDTPDEDDDGDGLPDAEPLDEIVAASKALRAQATALGRENEWAKDSLADFVLKLGAAEAGLKAQRPTRCPMCKGEHCSRCRQRGWVTALRAQQLRETQS